jgi:hypothetical protein
VSDIANSIELDVLMNDLGMGISILSAIGEHWSSAKRSRDILDDLARSTIRWVKSLKTKGNLEKVTVQEGRETDVSFETGMSNIDGLQDGSNLSAELDRGFASNRNGTSDILPDLQVQDGFWFSPDDQPGSTVNVYDMMQNLFNDFIPQMNNFTDDTPFYNA